MTTDISKLKIVPESKFFKVENGEIGFCPACSKRIWCVVSAVQNKDYLKLISAVGCFEWYEYLSLLYISARTSVINLTKVEFKKQMVKAKEQIQLWKGLADE